MVYCSKMVLHFEFRNEGKLVMDNVHHIILAIDHTLTYRLPEAIPIPCLRLTEQYHGRWVRLTVQKRNALYAQTMSVGTGVWERLELTISLAMQQTVFWLLSGCLAIVELSTLRI